MRRVHNSVVLLLVAAVTAISAMMIAVKDPAVAMPARPQAHQHLAVWRTDRSSRDTDRLASALPVSDAKSTAFLPAVFGGQGSTCSVQSPFSLEVAALHQIVPSVEGAYSTHTMTDAEWWALYQDAFPSLAAALKASGACWTRVRVDWAMIQPEPPPAEYVWGPYHDERLRLVAETGVHQIAIVDGIPEWAGNSVFGPIDSDRLDEFTQFLTELVTRYKEPPYDIHHWELFNEPDRTTADGVPVGWGYEGDRYAQMLAVAYPAIKAADPQATVLMGGLAYDWFTEYRGPFNRYFPDKVMTSGGGDHLDVTSFHYFPDFSAEWERWDPKSEERRNGWLPAPSCGKVDDGRGTAYEAGGIDLIAKISHFRNRLATCFGLYKPVWVTELGEHGYAGDSDSLAGQARYVIQGYARGLAAGIQNITWFALVSPPYDPYDQGLLFQDDWSPKPSYFAYQTMTRELADHTYVDTLDVQGVEAYVFQDAAQQAKTVAWNRYPGESAQLTFAGHSRLRVVDRSGNVMFVEDGGSGDLDGTANGSVSLNMTADPVFVSR